jgi:cystathionine gamma-lyase / homocysteine desulfhydrase
MDKITQLLHCRVDLEGSKPAVTPIFQNSAFRSESPYFYTRKDNPNVKELEELFKILENSRYGIVSTTGMSSIFLILHLLPPNSSLVINQDMYGCSYKICQKYAALFNIDLHVKDLSVKKNIDMLSGKFDMIFFETPTNPFLKTIDIAYVSNKVKSLNKECLVVVDNTWATPLYQHPLQLGADIVVYSATKYFSGHSDVMGGIIMTDNESIDKKLRDLRFYSGSIIQPQSAWLLRRSMQTFSLRMIQHSLTTVKIVDFLNTCPQIDKVYYPKIDAAQLTNYGTLIFFEFTQNLLDKYEAFSKALTLFDTGTGMACVTSMVAQPFSGSHASLTEQEKKEMGIGKGLVRLSFGLESPDDLIADIRQAFQSIEDPG